jgi:hypothetical protein
LSPIAKYVPVLTSVAATLLGEFLD